MSAEERQSIYNNAFSLAMWDGATDAEAGRKAEGVADDAELSEEYGPEHFRDGSLNVRRADSLERNARRVYESDRE